MAFLLVGDNRSPLAPLVFTLACREVLFADCCFGPPDDGIASTAARSFSESPHDPSSTPLLGLQAVWLSFDDVWCFGPRVCPSRILPLKEVSSSEAAGEGAETARPVAVLDVQWTCRCSFLRAFFVVVGSHPDPDPSVDSPPVLALFAAEEPTREMHSSSLPYGDVPIQSSAPWNAGPRRLTIP